MSEEMRQRLVERDTMARLFHGFVCVVTFLFGLFSPRTLAASIYDSALGPGIIAAYGIVGVLILADAWVNDVRPPEEQLRWTSRYRHYLHVGAALLNVTAGYSQALQDRSGVLELAVNAVWFIGASAFGVAIAWRDGRRRQGHALWGT